MDEMNNENLTNENPRPVNPRRRKRSQMQIFKEAYLPVIIAGVAGLLILIFIIGSIVRSVQNAKIDKEASLAASASEAAQKEIWDQDAARLLAIAEQQAAGFDYLGAIATIDSFEGKLEDYEELAAKRTEYATAQDKMVPWDDPNEIVNLSFHMLIADLPRALDDDDFGESYNRNFVTTTEFSQILQELHNNGYVLVDMDDFITTTTNAAGATVYSSKTLYLPQGKKPLMITQTGVNYYEYMIDGDGDGAADEDGAGFASRLVLDSNGKITCEMVDASGTTVYGAYDLVPILNAFIEQNPDFSFKGARATLALTGYEGLFGYRTNPGAEDDLGEDEYNKQYQDCLAVISALKSEGYTLACYTYENNPYGNDEEVSVSTVEDEMKWWTEEVTPLLGQTDVFVFARESDLADKGEAYSGNKFNVLKNAGFKYYLGFSTTGEPWTEITETYVRQGRILVTGSNMAHHVDWFIGMFDSAGILDETRGDVPT